MPSRLTGSRSQPQVILAVIPQAGLSVLAVATCICIGPQDSRTTPVAGSLIELTALILQLDSLTMKDLINALLFSPLILTLEAAF